MNVPHADESAAGPTPGQAEARTWRDLAHGDLLAMCEGRPVSGAQLIARLILHPRWRAVVRWRWAHELMRRRWTKPLGLWVTAGTLRSTGAELQPTATIGPRVVLKHTTGLVVGGDVVAGSDLVLHQNVTLGDRRPYGGQPRLGDRVTVGAGACVLGPIHVGNDVVIAANSVVLEDAPDGVILAGSPARIVRHVTGSEQAR